VALAFDAATGLSPQEVFRSAIALPDQIGLHTVTLDWYARAGSPPSNPQPAGPTTHRICTSWRAMTPNLPQELGDWAYKQFMMWTCEWAAGQGDEKEICDAIIANVRHSGLHYGRTTPVPVRNVRELLIEREAMCGVWYKAFQQMAH